MPISKILTKFIKNQARLQVSANQRLCFKGKKSKTWEFLERFPRHCIYVDDYFQKFITHPPWVLHPGQYMPNPEIRYRWGASSRSWRACSAAAERRVNFRRVARPWLSLCGNSPSAWTTHGDRLNWTEKRSVRQLAADSLSLIISLITALSEHL